MQAGREPEPGLKIAMFDTPSSGVIIGVCWKPAGVMVAVRTRPAIFAGNLQEGDTYAFHQSDDFKCRHRRGYR